MTTVRFATRDDLPRLWEMIWGLATYERWTEYVTGTPEKLGEMLFGWLGSNGAHAGVVRELLAQPLPPPLAVRLAALPVARPA